MPVNKVTMIDLARAHAPLDAELHAAFTRVLTSGHFILGAEVAAFERELAVMLGVSHAIGCSSGTDALLAALMALDLEPVARVLGLSDRTLQRRLQELGTTFQREVTTTRLAEVQRRLLDTDDALTAIAVDLGFASPQHLSALFKKELGVTPSEWRRRRRGPP